MDGAHVDMPRQLIVGPVLQEEGGRGGSVLSFTLPSPFRKPLAIEYSSEVYLMKPLYISSVDVGSSVLTHPPDRPQRSPYAL